MIDRVRVGKIAQAKAVSREGCLNERGDWWSISAARVLWIRPKANLKTRTAFGSAKQQTDSLLLLLLSSLSLSLSFSLSLSLLAKYWLGVIHEEILLSEKPNGSTGYLEKVWHKAPLSLFSFFISFSFSPSCSSHRCVQLKSFHSCHTQQQEK